MRARGCIWPFRRGASPRRSPTCSPEAPTTGPRAAYVERIREGYQEAGLSSDAFEALRAAVAAAPPPPLSPPPGAGLWPWREARPPRGPPPRALWFPPKPPPPVDRLLVFAYGNEMGGLRAHGALGGAPLVAIAETPPFFELHSQDDEAILRTHGWSAVRGEVYEVTPGVLASFAVQSAARGLVRATLTVRELSRTGLATGATLRVIAYVGEQRATRRKRLWPPNWRAHAGRGLR